MTDSSGRSPIQRRLAIDRSKIFGRIGVVVGALYTVYEVWSFVDSGYQLPRLFLIILGLTFVVQGIARLRRAAQLTMQLEQEFGPGAGVQKRLTSR